MTGNLINWFEIPVINIERAGRFYKTVLQLRMEPVSMDECECRFFQAEGVSGALMQGKDYTPSDKGVMIYFNCGEDLTPCLDRVIKAGGSIIVEKTLIAQEIGYFARILDTEGNLISLFSKK